VELAPQRKLDDQDLVGPPEVPEFSRFLKRLPTHHALKNIQQSEARRRAAKPFDRVGFVEIPPYCENLQPDVVYMERQLLPSA
jgi:hypothetical protein